MNAPICMGVAGCGYWGPNLVRNFQSLPGCSVGGICDLDTNRLNHLRTLYPALKTHTRFDDLLGDPRINAVAIATPIRSHYSMARKSLLAGKHTLVEKPLATSSAECEELVSLADQKGLVLMVGHTFLYSPFVRAIKKIVDDGDIGEIQYIASRRLNLGLFQNDINVTWDLAPHDLSIILHIMEESPTSVNCVGSSHITRGIEDISNLYLTFSRRRCAMITSSWLDPRKVREMTIVGSRRMIVYDDVQPNEKIRIYDARVEAPPHYDTFAEFQYAYHYGDIYLPYVKQEEPLRVECQHFLDCIDKGLAPISGGRQGSDLVRILYAASISLQNGGRAVDLQAPSAVKAAPRAEPTPCKPPNGHGRVNGRSSGNGRLPRPRKDAAEGVPA